MKTTINTCSLTLIATLFSTSVLCQEIESTQVKEEQNNAEQTSSNPILSFILSNNTLADIFCPIVDECEGQD